MSKKLKEVQTEKIMKFVTKNPKCEVATVITKTGIAKSTTYGIMKNLRDAGKLIMTNGLYSIADVPATITKKKPVVDKTAKSIVVIPKLEVVREEVKEEAPVAVNKEVETTDIGKNFGRDFAKHTVNGEELRKGKAVHMIPFLFVKDNPMPYKEFAALIPGHETLVRKFGLWKPNVEARKINLGGRQRYHQRLNMILEFTCGARICITNQISKHNFPTIMEAYEKAGMLKGIEYAPVEA